MSIIVSGANTKISGSATSTGSFGSVHTSGYVGIGTSTPTHMLHVYEPATGAYEGVKFYSTIKIHYHSST